MGDNSGINRIFGFVESLKANYFCGICKATSKTSSEMRVEDESKLRTPCNYDEDAQEADDSQSGIQEQCVFNKWKM